PLNPSALSSTLWRSRQRAPYSRSRMPHDWFIIVSSHPPHKHPNEELVIIREGTVECLVNGEWKRLGPGSVIFNASNQLHALKNVGTVPATYHVINWQSPGMLKKPQP